MAIEADDSGRDFRLMCYLRELDWQGRVAGAAAYSYLEEAVKSAEKTADAGFELPIEQWSNDAWLAEQSRAFAGLHWFLATAGTMSRLLWPRSSKAANARGKWLRDECGVEGSALAMRDARDALEHLDERIDIVLAGPQVMLADQIFGAFTKDQMDPPALRLLDPQTGDVAVWGNRLNYRRLWAEMSRIAGLSRSRWGLIPFWGKQAPSV